jgi:hypothetical protein
MDINFKRRSSEIAIAKEIALAMAGVNGSIPDAQGKLIEQINLACERHQLDEAAYHRVMGYLDREADKTTRDVTRANEQVLSINQALETVIGRAS